jgi:SAM-dependent methyltransferase
VLVNTAAGLLFGWIYWHWGLRYAILCHFMGGLVSSLDRGCLADRNVPSPALALRVIYGKELALIHHTAFGGFARDVAPELVALLRNSAALGSLIVDLGCGSGILAAALTASGYAVLGIDVSPAMIELARETAPQARFQVASMYDIALPECAAVFSIGEGVSYVQGNASSVKLTSLLRKVYHALQPGGLLVFDVVEASAGSLMNYRAEERYGAYRLVTVVSESADTPIITREISIARVDSPRDVFVEQHRVQTFSEGELHATLTSVGFIPQFVRSYGRVPLLPRRLGVIAVKPLSA